MNVRILTVAALALAVPSALAAQEHKCACCAGHGSHASAAAPQTPAPPQPQPQTRAVPRAVPPTYDVEYESLLVGVVESVMRHEGMDVQITLGVGENRMEVIVAPKDWLDANNFVFRPGERIEVVGARHISEPTDTMVAREIRTASATMILRDSEGRPLWNY